MRCDKCQGSGKEPYSAPYMPAIGLYTTALHPCSRCGGSGIDHCCDGIRAEGCVDEEGDEQ